MTIDLLTAFIIAAVTALVVVLVMRSIAARQVAETRAASIAELAATKQDLKWVREDAERKAQALDSAQTLLDNTEKRLRDTFQALAADALKDNRASFLDLAKTSFQSYQQPIAESLSRVDQRLREAERERVEAYSRLSEQVVALGSTANTLSRALRTPAVRGRWGIESMHWQLDVTFGEDQSRTRLGHADTNFSVLRRAALGLLKNETTAKVGIKNRRLRAGWDESYLEKVLFGQ